MPYGRPYSPLVGGSDLIHPSYPQTGEERFKRLNTISVKDLVWIRRRVKASGVPPKIATPIMDLFIRWGEHSGLEWSITRFKSVKNDFVRMSAGLIPVSTWIKSSRDNHTKFGGEIGVLERWVAQEERNLAPALALLNIYSNFYATKPTKAQVVKFLSAVAAPKVMVSTQIKRAVLLGVRLAGLKKKRKLPHADPLLSYNPSETKWAPTPFGRKREEEGIVDSVGYLLSTAGNLHYHKYQEYYGPVLQGLEPEILLGRNFLLPSVPFSAAVAGRIGLLQEPGFKLRSVANPGRVFQQVLSPLGDSLFQTLRDLPWDCTFEQSKADSVLQRATTEQTRVVRSVDLSNATDYFPLDLQLEVLYALFPHDKGLVSLFAEVSRFSWECSLPNSDLIQYGFNTPGKISWSMGQPLGLYPSFASFALTHGLLLLGLLGKEWNEEFFILGDDVVILDDDLYTRYLSTLEALGCPVSSHKTISSSRLAEFRSVIFFNGKQIPNYKWRKPSDDSFLDILKNVGPGLVPVLTPRQRRVVQAVGPLPVELGGLGWNPKGLSLDLRLSPWMSYILREKAGLEHLTDYSGHLSRLLWQSDLVRLTRKVGLSLENDFSFFDTFDQKVISLVRVSLGSSLVPMRRVLGLNLDKVVDNVDLPIPGVRKFQKVSNLLHWESVIKTLPALDSDIKSDS